MMTFEITEPDWLITSLPDSVQRIAIQLPGDTSNGGASVEMNNARAKRGVWKYWSYKTRVGFNGTYDIRQAKIPLQKYCWTCNRLGKRVQKSSNSIRENRWQLPRNGKNRDLKNAAKLVL